MTQDLSHVPRRLRRFYRHNEPVPAGMETGESIPAQPASAAQPFSIFGKKSANPAPPQEHVPEDEALHEPWMDATPSRRESAAPAPPTPVSRREQRKNAQGAIDFRAPMPAGPASPPQGLFARVMNAAAPKPKPMDQALGLQKKQLFEDRLPSSSEKAMQAASTPAPAGNSELQSTLNELKRLAATNTTAAPSPVSLTSFHFTPAEGAPNPVEGKPGQGNALDPNTLTPRQRVEMRRMRSGETGFGAAGSDREENASIAPSASPSSSAQETPAHIRRSMGQVTSSRTENEAEPTEAHESSTSLPDDAEDFKSLMGGSTKKKKAKKSDEEEDFSIEDDLDGDITPFDEDEK